MNCPNGDGTLISHTTHGEQNLTVSYATCPTCHGYWMDSFAANFIKISRSSTPTKRPATILTCPVCTSQLVRTTGENIPDAVMVFKCSNHHGYFFPSGQLAAWKEAQRTKIAYHKLWNIPLPSVASVLLAGLLLFVLVGALKQRQVTTSEAQQFYASQHAYVIPRVHEVLIAAQTTQNARLALHIPQLSLVTTMTTTDGKTHQYVLENVRSGTYTYWFSFETIESDHSQFTMP